MSKVHKLCTPVINDINFVLDKLNQLDDSVEDFRDCFYGFDMICYKDSYQDCVSLLFKFEDESGYIQRKAKHYVRLIHQIVASTNLDCVVCVRKNLSGDYVLVIGQYVDVGENS